VATLDYREILARMAAKRLAVVGDCMVDRFLWGEVDRISPEAPVPVVRLKRETRKLGGAANVAGNIRTLGAEVVLIGVIGADDGGRHFQIMLTEQGLSTAGIVSLPGRPTTVKTRIIASHQQIVRTDLESDTPLSGAEADLLLQRLEASGPYDGIILSDYGKGVLTPANLERLIDFGRAREAVITVDPKGGDFSQYRGVTSLTPNQREAGSACAVHITDGASLAHVGRTLLARVEAEAVLITRGELGMALFEKDGRDHHLSTEATEVFDVTGAGDTVIATYTAALATGASFLVAATLANHAASVTAAQIAAALEL
jgi:rfaE bifunctional protein kinase chain/domain